MQPVYFATSAEFRAWLSLHSGRAELLWVGCYKAGSGKASVTWPQSVDEALCFGWIDGVRKSIDAESYSIRFTPRKHTSIWSAVNIKKMEELIEKELMQPAGLAIFQKRTENKSMIYAYENEAKKLSTEYEKIFKANKKAWIFFTTQAPSYQK